MLCDLKIEVKLVIYWLSYVLDLIHAYRANNQVMDARDTLESRREARELLEVLPRATLASRGFSRRTLALSIDLDCTELPAVL